MINTKAFPENVEFEALLTFSGEAKGNLIMQLSGLETEKLYLL